jgi:hypothetical protein
MRPAISGGIGWDAMQWMRECGRWSAARSGGRSAGREAQRGGEYRGSHGVDGWDERGKRKGWNGKRNRPTVPREVA